MIKLHDLATNTLQAPSLAWNSLCWYWALSFFGMGPRYLEYMQSGEADIDRMCEPTAPIGLEVNLTIEQRFNRAVDYYEYCFIEGTKSAINAPWDLPPTLQVVMDFRNRMEPKARDLDVTIDSSIEELLDEKTRALWRTGGEIQRQEKARLYAEQTKAAMAYIISEVQPRMQLTMDQLNKDTGFLDTGYVRYAEGIFPEHMDEAMPQETQWDKLGDVYIDPMSKNVMAYGIIGRYYKAGHQLEQLMTTPERQSELSYAHNMFLHTWAQLMEIRKNV